MKAFTDRGETLVESIVSLVLFGILVPSVSMVIGTAMNHTSVSINRAEGQQTEANEIFLENSLNRASAELSLTCDKISAEIDIPVRLYVTEDYTAFYPEVGP